ncbi:hypothetical protein IEQ34_002977 [Dendrobium chrysotoxum]|uniref:Uncharacterized protein n=1 Tax=Dendrobium chrysotoxum TaxID=161865 RepID=A0AAV7HJ50_DENCH|nr:hypothetical protein IEQ34_002977 [Dendrobium chrysotoxum]
MSVNGYKIQVLVNYRSFTFIFSNKGAVFLFLSYFLQIKFNKLLQSKLSVEEKSPQSHPKPEQLT